MAEYRQIHCAIWRDDWFLELSPDEKLLFIYLFSNENTNLAGIYKLSIRHAQLETGMDAERITTLLALFESAGKVVHLDGYIWIKNLRKYNASRSPKTASAISAVLDGIPDCAIKRAYITYYSGGIPYQYGIDTSLTKQNKTKQNNNSEVEAVEDTLSERPAIFLLYEQAIGPLTGLISEELQEAEREYPQDWIEDAFRETARQNKHNWKYTQAILKSWKSNGGKRSGTKAEQEPYAAEVYK
jgi:DnaD/phage-associated family protein